MIEVDMRVWIPRSNGAETIGIVKQILPACPSIGEMIDMAEVTWSQDVPSNEAYPEAHAMSGNPCVRMVRMHFHKWVPLSRLRPAPIAA